MVTLTLSEPDALKPDTIDESGADNASTVTATLNRASSEALTLTVVAAAGTHAVSGDFTQTGTTLTIAAGSTASTGVVTVTANDDTTDEPDKSVTISATVSGDSGVADPAAVTLTIADDDAAPTVTLALVDSSISEAGGTTTVTATLSHASSAATTVTVTAAAGYYTVGSDAAIVIAAGETATASDGVTITAVDDNVDNVGDRRVTVTGTAANAQAAAESQTMAVTGAALTLTDDEDMPTVTLTLSEPDAAKPDTIAESGADNASTVTATLNRASSVAVTLTVSASAGTHAVSGDFTQTGTMLTIAAGSTASTGVVTVTANDDTTDEPDKSVTVSATVSGASGVADPSAVTLTIADDDAAPAVTLVVADSAIDEAGGGTTVTATLSHPSSAATTVTVTAAAGYYTVGSDAAIVIAAGETATASDGVRITAVDDDVDNVGDRRVTVTGTAANAQAAAESETVTVTGVSLTLTDDEDPPAVTLALSEPDPSKPDTIAESGVDNVSTVTATLNRASSAAVTLTVSASAGTHAVSGDFTQTGTTLTIAAGETASTGVVTVTANDDTTDEPDKSITVSATVSGDSGVADPSAVTLTITDDDAAPAVTLALADAAIAEAGGTTTVTATLSHASSAATTVTVTAAAGYYTVGSDAAIVIAAGETATASDGATLTAVDDAIDNVGDRRVTVTGTAANAQAAAESQTMAVTGATLMLTDDENPPTVTLALSEPDSSKLDTINENGADNTSTVTATLNRASSEAVTLTVSATAGTHAADGDFTQMGTTLTIAAGETASTGVVTVTANDDTTDAPNKSVTVSATVSGDSGVADPSAVTLTIADDDAAPAVTLAVADSSISENGGATTVTAALSHASSAETTVTVTAVAGAYTVGSDGEIVIAAGETATASDGVKITAVDDAIDNVGDRRVTVTGTAANAQAAAESETVTVTGAALTLTDDEDSPTVTLALSEPDSSKPDTINEGGADNASTVTATLNRASSEAVTLTVSASAGTNAADRDFTQTGTTLTIAAGETASTGVVTVTANDDTTDEQDKSVTVSATVSGASGVADPAAVTLTIADDDAAPAVTLAVADSAIAEAGGTTTVTATLSHPSSAATTVTVTAVAGFYTVESDAAIVIAAGETATATDGVKITAVDDAIDNVGHRRVTVTGTAANAQAAAESETVTVTGAALTLTNDENMPTVTLALSEPDAAKPDTINESGVGNASTVTATLNRASSEAVTLTVAATAGTHAADGDFTLSNPATLIIAAGETAGTGVVTVTANDNPVDEPDKAVTVSATVSGASGVADPSAVTLTIADDDAAPSLSISAPSVAEGAAGASAALDWTVALSAASGRAVTVAYAEGTGGTATAGTDYTALAAGTLTFAAGETSKTVSVTVTGDATDEPDETVVVTLSAPSNATIPDGAASGTGTIMDDDAAPTVALALADSSIAENGGATTVTATLSHPSSAATTVTVTAVAGFYTVESDAAIVIAAGETATVSDGVMITAVDDAIDNVGDRRVTVTGTAANAQAAAESQTVTVTGAALTLTDDEDTPTVTLLLSEPDPSKQDTIAESGADNASTVTATLNRASSEAVTLTVSAVAGTHAVSGDFTQTGTTLTIAAGSTASTGVVTVTANDDTTDGPDKSITVSATVSGASGVADPSAVTLTIADDDAAPAVTLALSDSAIAEAGGTTTVTATLSHPLSAATTVTVTAAAGYYTVGSDAAIVIAAGETATASDGVTITAVDDAVDNVGDRRVTVTGTAANAQAAAESQTMAVTGVAVTLKDDETTPTVTLALSEPDAAKPDTIAESGAGTASTVTARLSGPSSEAVTLTVSATAGTNAADGDFMLSSVKTLLIAAGSTASTGTVTVTANDNATDAPDKAVRVTATVSGASGVSNPSAVTLTIADDDAAPSVTLALAAASIAEAGGTTTVSATLSHPSSAATTVTVTAVSGFYTPGSDAEIVIAAGSTSSATDTATITAVDDDVDNVGDRRVTVTGTAANAQAAAESQTVAVTGAALTLTDDEATPTVTLALSEPEATKPDTIAESGVGNASTVTARLSGPSSEAVMLTVSATAGTHAADGDFTLSSVKTLTIAAGLTASTGTVTVTAADNATDEPDKAVTVSATVSGRSGIADPAAVTLTIADDDAAPAVSISSPSVSEGASGATAALAFEVTLDAASGKRVTVEYAEGPGGTAATGTDYTALAGGTLTFAAGETSKTVTVTVTGDTLDEPNETVRVVLSGPANATLGTAEGTGTIADDDAAPSVTLVLSAASISEDGGAATVTATLSHPSSEATTVTVTATAGAHTAAADFRQTGTTLAVAAGETTSAGTVTVAAVNDAEDAEHDKTVAVTATAANGQGVAAPPSPVTLTITDDDVNLKPTFGDATVADQSWLISTEIPRLTLPAATGGDGVLTYTLAPALPSWLRWSGFFVTGTTPAEPVVAADYTWTVRDADGDEASLPFAIEVVGSVVMTPDVAPSLSLSSPSVAEGASGTTATLRYEVVLSMESTEEVVVAYADAGTGTALSGTDYTALSSGTLTFAAGETSKTLDVTVRGDGTDEPDETVAVGLSGPVNAQVPVSGRTGTGTIMDDDAAPGVTLAVGELAIDEAGGVTTVTATLSHPSSAATTVTVTGVPGFYTAGSDATIVIAAGATASTTDVATIAAVNDDVDNVGDRRVTVTGTAANAQAAAESQTVTVTGVAVTLRDDETTPTVTLALSEPDAAKPDTIAESGAGTASTVTARLSGPSSEAVTLTVSATAGTNAADGDFTLSSVKTLLIAAGSTASTGVVTVTANDNATDAPDKAVRVTATVSGASGVSNPTAVTLTIADDDAAPSVTLALAAASIAEAGGTTTVSATLSHPSSAATTVTVTAVSGFYTTGSDATIVIAAGATASATDVATITAVNDNVDNVGDRRVTVTGTAANAQAAAESQTVTVTGAALTLRDDEATPTVTLALSEPDPSKLDTIAESGADNASTVTARLSGPSSEAVTLTVSAVAGAHAAVGDFTQTGTTLTIAAGATASTGVVIVTANDDTTDEPAKSVTVSATVSGRIGIADPAAVTLTITDDDAAPGVMLAVADSSISENGGATTVTATLSHPSSAATTVTVTAAAGFYTVGSDAAIVIAAGETATASDGVTITAVDDAVDTVGDRRVTVTGTAANAQAAAESQTVTVTGASLTLTDDEDTPTVTLSLSEPDVAKPDTINEGGADNASTVTATLNRASSEAVTLTVSALAGTNAAASDFSLSSEKTLTIAAGATSSTGTVTVTAVNNTTDGPNKHVTVSAAVSGNSGVADPAAVTLTIADDDAVPAVTLALADSSISENGGATTVTATLSHASSAETTVTVNAVAGAYTVGSDATIVIAAGETANASDTATITAVNDDVDNVGDRSVMVTGTAANAQAAAESQTVAVTGATLTLTDDDDPPAVTLALSEPDSSKPDTINESGVDNVSTVTATLNRASSEAVTLAVSATAGTNAADGDFTQTGTTLTIAAGSTVSTGIVTVTANDNPTDEPDKAVRVTATVSGASGVANPAAVTLTIADDDGAPAVTLVLSAASISEDGGAATVTATLSHPSSEATTVTVTASAEAHTAAADFRQTGTTLAVAAGETTSTGTVTVAAVNDAEDAEHDKAVRVTATAANGQGVAGTPSPVTLTIEDDDVDRKPTFGAQQIASRLWPVSTVIPRLTLPRATGGDGVLTYTLSPALPAWLSRNGFFMTGTTPATPTNQKQYTWTATDADGDAASLEFLVAVIRPGDPPRLVNPPGLVVNTGDLPALALSSPRVPEGASGSTATLRYTLTLSAASTSTVAVSYADARTGTATAGVDYTALSAGTLTVAPGATSATVTVTVRGDGIDEPAETVAVVLSGPVNARMPASGRTGTGTIEDDDEAPTVTLAVAATTISENGGTTTVTANLSHPSSAATTVTVTEVSGYYTAGSDATIVIAAGETASATDVATVAAVNNTMDEPDRSVTVTATVANDVGAGSVTGASLTLTDDDAAPGVTLAVADPAIDEAGGVTTVTATLSHPSSAATTVTVTALAGAYTVDATNATIVIAAGATADASATASITAVDDAVDNGAGRAVQVTGRAGNSQGIGPVTAAALTLRDDEARAVVTLTLSSSMISEKNGSTTVTATLLPASSAATAITVSAAAGANTGPGDFALSPNQSLSIAAGATTSTGQVAIDAVDNTATAATKAVTVSATAQNANGVTGPTPVRLTITEDDPTADAGEDQTVSEGTVATLDGSGSSDPDGEPLSYSWRQNGGNSTVTLMGASTATPTFTAPELTAGTALTFELTVTAGGASATDAVAVVIQADNDPPTANAGADQTVSEGMAVTLAGSGSDPEDDPLSYSWRQSGSNPTVLLTGASTATPTFTAPELTAGTTLTFELTVTAGGASATDAVAVVIQADNDPPTADAGADQTVAEGMAVTLAGSGSDPEDEALTYAWRQSGSHPTVPLTGASTATPTFTAPELTAGTMLTFELTVTAGGASATDTVAVVIQADNDPPTADAGSDQTVSEGSAVTLAGSGSDPEDAALSYSWRQSGSNPTVPLAGASTTTPTFTAPELTGATTLTFELTVTAGGASATDAVAVVIQADNDPPTADAGSDQTVTEGTAVTLTGSGSDPEEDPLSYAWRQSGSNPTVPLAGASTTTPTFTAPELTAGTTLTFELTVTAGGASATDAVAVVIQADNDPPTADAGSDQTVTEGTAVTLTGSGSDPEDAALSYSWRQSGSNPTVLLTGASTATPTFTAPELTAGTTLTFELTVTAGGASATDAVAVVIQADNDPPTANAGADQTVAEGMAVTLAGSGTDPEDDPLSYSWRQSGSNPTVPLMGASTATPTFTAPELTAGTALTFELTVTAGGASATDAVAVVIQADNDPPTANAGADQTVSEGMAVTLAGSGSDPEEAALSYAWRQSGNNPTVPLAGASTATPTFTAPELTAGTALTFELTVTAGGASAMDTVAVVIQADNDPPTANAGDDQTVSEGMAVTLVGSGSDPEDAALSYSWRQSGSNPMVTLAGVSTATPTFTAPELTGTTTLTFELTVTAGGASATDAVAVVIQADNDPPTADAGADQTVAEGMAVTLAGSGSDPEDAALSYSWRQSGSNPTVPLAGASTATPTFTAPELTAGTALTFELTVTAGGASATDAVAVVIQADNDPPTADAGSDQTVTEGTAVTLTGSGSDPEDAALSYSWRQSGSNPTVPLAGASTATPTFTAPELTAGTTLTFELTVTAGGASATDAVAVVIQADNDPPTADAGSDQTVTEGTAVTLTGSGSDPEDAALSYSWRQSGSNPMVTLAGASTATPTFTAPELTGATTLTFELTVTAGGASATDAVAVVIQADNDPPTANAGADQTVAEGTVVTLDGGGSTDPERQPLTYAWTPLGDPTVTLSTPATVAPTFTAPTQLAANAFLTFSLTVTDPGLVSATDTVIITVTAGTNDPPTANAGADQTVAEGTVVTLDGGGSTDPERQPLTYAWTPLGDPTVTLSTPATVAPTFTAPTQLAANAFLTFSLTVTDPGLVSATDTVIITVTAGTNDPPTANAGADQTVSEGTAVTLTGSGTDPEDEPLSYSWRQTGGTATVPLTGAGTATPSFTAPNLTATETLTFELTVTAGGASATDAVTVTVLTRSLGGAELGPTFGDATIDDQAWTQHVEISAFTLPTATGGTGTLTYDLSPALPDGATRDAATHEVTGTPTVGQGETTYTWRATDANGATADLAFTITVLTRSHGGAEVGPTFGDATIADQAWTQHVEIPAFTLPTATGGTGPVTYDLSLALPDGVTRDAGTGRPRSSRLSPALPAGVTRDAATHEVTGTPTVAQEETTYTWTATDEAGATATLSFTITVAADLQPVFQEGVEAQRYRVGTAVSLTLPAATGGDGELRYALAPAPPSGLTFDPGTLMLSGTPTEAVAQEDCILTATDEDGDAATLVFAVEVVSRDGTSPFPDAPANLRGLPNDMQVTLVWDDPVDSTIVAYHVRVAAEPSWEYGRWTEIEDSDATTTDHTVDDLKNGVEYRFQLRAMNNVGNGPKAQTMAVPPAWSTSPDALPTFGGATVSAQRYVQYTAIPILTLPRATGGDGRLTHTLTPRTLPAGLTFDPATRTLSGTPTAVQASTMYTWTARDVDGDESRLMFPMEVVSGVRTRDLGLVLAGVGRTLATDAVDVLGGRFGSPAPSRVQVILGGQVLGLTEDGGGTESDAVSEESAGSAAGAETGTWQRVTGLALDVARAFGVVIDGGTGQPLASPSPSSFEGEGRMRGAWQPQDRVQPVSGKELLARSAFELPLTRSGEDGVPALTLWGRGSAGGFSGAPENDFTMDGTLYSGYLGLDYRPKPTVLLGLGMSHSTGDVNYERTAVSERGGVDVKLTNVFPYAHWQPRPGLGVWSMLGAGWGEMEVKLAGDAGQTRTTDLTSLMGAVGGRQALMTWQGIDLAAKTDAFLTTLRSSGKTNLPGARGHAERVRLLVEGRMEWMPSAESRMQPRLELGGRWDSGTAEQGLGAEIGGGLAYTQTTWGLSVEAQGRYLVAHQDGSFKDWGASLNVRLDPGVAGQGAYLTVSPAWGQAASGVEQLWGSPSAVTEDVVGSRPGTPGWQPQQFQVDVGYGLALSGGRGLMTPYGGLAIEGAGASRYRLGGRLDLASFLTLSLEGEHTKQPGQAATHGITLRLDWQP